ALSGDLWACDIDTARCRRLDVTGPVVDPRIDPTGRYLAYTSGRALHVVTAETADPVLTLEPESDDITWGQAEFVAAEEMGRMRGFWWEPNGRSLLVERASTEPVGTWFLTDPAFPERAPQAVKYPAAGTPNVAVQLW